jgi:hypothetical protein
MTGDARLSDDAPNGPCCLCGHVGPLSFEHVPPQKAFNQDTVLLTEVKRLLGSDWWSEVKKPSGGTQKRGAAKFTLCERRNNSTGHLYASEYVRLVRAAMPAMFAAAAGDVVGVSAKIRPLRILKQILVMFCSACGPHFIEQHPRLTRYLLNADSRDLPPDLQVYLALYDRRSMASRQAGITVRLNTSGAVVRYAEISFPPFILVVTDDSPSPDGRLMNVTWFNRYGYNERWHSSLPLDCMQTNSFVPGSYATRAEIEKARLARGLPID